MGTGAVVGEALESEFTGAPAWPDWAGATGTNCEVISKENTIQGSLEIDQDIRFVDWLHALIARELRRFGIRDAGAIADQVVRDVQQARRCESVYVHAEPRVDRRKIEALSESGMPIGQIAGTIGVSDRTVRRVIRRVRSRGA